MAATYSCYRQDCKISILQSKLHLLSRWNQTYSQHLYTYLRIWEKSLSLRLFITILVLGVRERIWTFWPQLQKHYQIPEPQKFTPRVLFPYLQSWILDFEVWSYLYVICRNNPSWNPEPEICIFLGKYPEKIVALISDFGIRSSLDFFWWELQTWTPEPNPYVLIPWRPKVSLSF